MILKSVIRTSIIVFIFTGFVNLCATSGAPGALKPRVDVNTLIDQLAAVDLEGHPVELGLPVVVTAQQASALQLRKKVIVLDRLLEHIEQNLELPEEQQVILRQTRQVIQWAGIKTPAKKQKFMAKALDVMNNMLLDIAKQAGSTTRWLTIAGTTTVIAGMISTKLARSVACSVLPNSTFYVLYNFGAETLNAALGTPLFTTC